MDLFIKLHKLQELGLVPFSVFLILIIAWIISGINDAPLIAEMPWKYVGYAFGAEIMGGFIFNLFILVSTTSDTTFCNANIQVYIFIPTMLLIAR